MPYVDNKMANNKSIFVHNYGGIYPGTTKTHYLEMGDNELVSEFCNEHKGEVGPCPDYVSSNVLPAIKESYRLKNLCIDAYLKYKEAKEKGNTNSILLDKHQYTFMQSQDAWNRSISAGIAAIKASNEGTLGKRNVGTSGLVMQQENHNRAARSAFYQAPGNAKGGKSRRNRMRKNRKSRRARA